MLYPYVISLYNPIHGMLTVSCSFERVGTFILRPCHVSSLYPILSELRGYRLSLSRGLILRIGLLPLEVKGAGEVQRLAR